MTQRRNAMRTLCLMAGIAVCIFHAPAFAQNSAAAAAEIRFQQLEKEIRRLTRMIEEQNFEIQNLKSQLERDVGNMGVRVADLEQATGRTAAGTPLTADMTGVGGLSPIDKVSSAPPSEDGLDGQSAQSTQNGSFNYQPPHNAEQSQTLGTLNQAQGVGVAGAGQDAAKAYDAAYSYIKMQDYARAEQAFAGFLQNHADHKLAENAQYWYGETFYVRGQFDRAARVFAEAYQKDPKGSKASSNLLKLGMSLVGLDKKDDACIAFQQLQDDFKNGSYSVLNRAQSEMDKIGCS